VTAKITVRNVGHGQCISLVHDNGNVMLWDCGSEGESRPSAFMPQSGNKMIDYFFITNYDEDHLSDLDLLRKTCLIRSIVYNDSISADQLYALKRESGPLTEGMESMVDMLREYNLGPLNPEPPFPDVSFTTFCNEYGLEFPDTNNISLVTFLACNGTTILMPGDLERKGWLALLKYGDFRSNLAKVDIFIAGHHGRESGYCREVFEYCKPDYFVFSDSKIQFATQKTADLYRGHTDGVINDRKRRKVFTTRNDGDLNWDL